MKSRSQKERQPWRAQGTQTDSHGEEEDRQREAALVSIVHSDRRALRSDRDTGITSRGPAERQSWRAEESGRVHAERHQT